MEKCENCKFWVQYSPTENNPENPEGKCRRSHPIVLELNLWAAWPTVSKNDWCGEFVSREISTGKSIYQLADKQAIRREQLKTQIDWLKSRTAEMEKELELGQPHAVKISE